MGKNKKVPSYLYFDDSDSNFSMITSNLLSSKEFQELSYAGRMFYIVLVTHKNTPEQRNCLYSSLKEYYMILGIDKPDVDIKCDAGLYPKAIKHSMLFVIPQKQLAQYGYSPQYASKLKKELIEHGFIKIKYGGKGKYNAWNDNVTVYEFTNDWKKLDSS